MANSCNKLMKEAIDVAVNEFRGIEFTYKLDDVLDSLSPNQKFSSNQLKGYLLKQGVSPNEIRASKMFEGFENDNRALAISDWKNAGVDQGFQVREMADYDTITLGSKGSDENANYKVREFVSNQNQELSTNLSHRFHDKSGADANYNNVTQLGWNRVHQDEINGKPTTVLNELQSDWMQAERQGNNVFESKSKLSKKEYDNFVSELLKKYNEPYLYSKDFSIDDVATKEELDRLQDFSPIRENRMIADFPMKPEKFQQLMIVDALNEAIENGTKRVAIPIERENELAGNAGVTKFYEQLNKKVLPDIRKKLEKQGLRVKVSMEDYKGELKLIDVPNIDLSDLERVAYTDISEAPEVLDRVTKTEYFKSFSDSSFYPYTLSIDKVLQNNSPDMVAGDLLVGLNKYSKSKTGNRLHILEIEEVPNARVKWDVYGLLAGLGLGGVASQSEAAEPISSTSGISPRETNSMNETMRLEGQPNIFRLQDLATGRTRVSKAKPKEKEILDYFSQKESKGDYNAKSSISSAYGKYQFLKDTLAEKARLHGMTVKEARTPQGQEELMRKVLKDYEARLRKFDLPITKENLFVVHNLGETGGIRAIRGTYTPEDVERMRNNIPGTKVERNSLSKSEVVKEYYKMHKVTKGS